RDQGRGVRGREARGPHPRGRRAGIGGDHLARRSSRRADRFRASLALDVTLTSTPARGTCSMTARRRIFAAPVATLFAIAAAAAQNVKAPAGYPERDILTPFRKVDQIVAPPDKVMAQLRLMRSIADAATVVKDFDKSGREIVDDDGWRAA